MAVGKNESQGFLAGLDPATRRFGHAVRKQLDRIEGLVNGDGLIAPGALAADAIRSANYLYVSGDFSSTGSFFDLANGNIVSPGLAVDGATGDVAVRGSITAEQLDILDGVGDIVISLYDVNSYDRGLEAIVADWVYPNSHSKLSLGGGGGGGDEARAFMKTRARFSAQNSEIGSYATENYLSSYLSVSDPGIGSAYVNAEHDETGTEGTDGLARVKLGARADIAAPWAKIELDQRYVGGVAQPSTILLESTGGVLDADDRYFTRSGTGNGAPQVFQRGVVSEAFSSVSAKNGTVSFPEAFISSPSVVISVEVPTNAGTYNGMTIYTYDVSTTGFAYKIVNQSGATLTATFKVHWIAEGPI